PFAREPRHEPPRRPHRSHGVRAGRPDTDGEQIENADGHDPSRRRFYPLAPAYPRPPGGHARAPRRLLYFAGPPAPAARRPTQPEEILSTRPTPCARAPTTPCSSSPPAPPASPP